MGEIHIEKVETRRQLREFIDFSNNLYENCPVYVPQLFTQEKALLSLANPYFEHSQAEYFLAHEGRSVVGRIAWFLNALHVRHSRQNEAFFGYFDCPRDPRVAGLLLDRVAERSRASGCEGLLGPINFSTNDTCGLLTSGFDRPPAVLMPYHRAYYGDLIRAHGFSPVMDLMAYEIRATAKPDFLDRKARELGDRLARHGIVVRPMEIKRFGDEVGKIFSIYEQVFSRNWGYMPMSRHDFFHSAKNLKSVTDPDFVLIAEKGDTVIGYTVAIYNANEVLRSVKHGRLLPFGFLKLVGFKKKVRSIKILNLGVIPPYQRLGVDVVMYSRLFEASALRGITTAEASYVMGNNTPMKNAILRMNGTVTKTYAIFHKSLDRPSHISS